MTPPLATCDSSLLVAALSSWHPLHTRAQVLIEERVDAIPAHALLESFSVLTRLPAEHRLSVSFVADALSQLRLKPLTLPAREQLAMLRSLAVVNIGGGAVYDGLVAATSKHHALVLISADHRARTTYDAIGVDYELI